MHHLYNKDLSKVFEDSFIKINELQKYCTKLANNTKYFQPIVNKIFVKKQISCGGTA